MRYLCNLWYCKFIFSSNFVDSYLKLKLDNLLPISGYNLYVQKIIFLFQFSQCFFQYQRSIFSKIFYNCLYRSVWFLRSSVKVVFTDSLFIKHMNVTKSLLINKTYKQTFQTSFQLNNNFNLPIYPYFLFFKNLSFFDPFFKLNFTFFD